MSRRGFTIIELIVVITIMGILVGLGVVNFRSTQINSRDAERRTDIETIGQYLDIYYTSGIETDLSTETDDATFSYPSTLQVIGSPPDVSNMIKYLRDIDEEVLMPPNTTSPVGAFVPATNSIQTVNDVEPLPTYSQYVYQPIKSDGTLCTLASDECRKYNLYYRLESNAAVQMVRSKYQ